jgi:hypothetical protein
MSWDLLKQTPGNGPRPNYVKPTTMEKKYKFLGSYRSDKMAYITGACIIIMVGLFVWAGLPWYWGLVVFLGYLLLFYVKRNAL